MKKNVYQRATLGEAKSKTSELLFRPCWALDPEPEHQWGILGGKKIVKTEGDAVILESDQNVGGKVQDQEKKRRSRDMKV